MFDPDIFESMPDHERIAVRNAIATIATSGIIERQLTRQFERLSEGDESEDIESLSHNILQYRKDSHGLKSLLTLGQHIMKELIDENS